MLPNFGPNCFLQSLHFHVLRVERNESLSEPQRGHTIPFGQRNSTKHARALFGSEKNSIASCRFVGYSIVSLLVCYYSSISYVRSSVKKGRKKNTPILKVGVSLNRGNNITHSISG